MHTSNTYLHRFKKCYTLNPNLTLQLFWFNISQAYAVFSEMKMYN